MSQLTANEMGIRITQNESRGNGIKIEVVIHTSFVPILALSFADHFQNPNSDLILKIAFQNPSKMKLQDDKHDKLLLKALVDKESTKKHLQRRCVEW